MGYSEIGKDALHLGGMGDDRRGRVATSLLYLDDVLPDDRIPNLVDLAAIGFSLDEVVDAIVYAYGGGVSYRWTDEALRARGRN